MSETTFNLYLPPCSVFGNSASPIPLTIYQYVNPILLSYYSGSNVSDLETFTIEEWGTSGSYSDNENIFNLFMDNNSMFNGSNGLYYETTIYNFYSGIPISYYITSNSSLGDMFPYTINELSMIKVA